MSLRSTFARLSSASVRAAIGTTPARLTSSELNRSHAPAPRKVISCGWRGNLQATLSRRDVGFVALRYGCFVLLLTSATAGRVERASGQGTGDTGGGGTRLTVITNQIAGVAIDVDGVLRMRKFADPGGRLSKRAIEAARASLDPEVSRRSEFRTISLNRLEAAVQAKLDRGERLDDEMRFLAGLNRLQYVFFFPESHDIVIAGPAEGWATDLSGRVRGYETGRPVIELRDLVVALRAFPPQTISTPVISCSIDPTREGLSRMQDFLQGLGGRAVARQTRFITNGLRESLGMHTITVTGVSAQTHFAQVLVEADFRMKMIGIGLERPRVKLKAYVDLVSPVAVSRNALQRWYFVPDYECVRVTEDKTAMELVGQRVKLIGANEIVAADGIRAASGCIDSASGRFTGGFTAKYEEIAKAVPVYAQLRNCIDVAVAAAFIKEQDFYERAGWTMDLFQDESRYQIQNVAAPERVETVVASVWKGRHLMTPVGGGVYIQPRLALSSENLLDNERDELVERRNACLDHLAEGQWWWD